MTIPVVPIIPLLSINLLRIFNSMGISINHIKELKTMLRDAPMIKEEGVFGYIFIK
jgi:hypothetical protein